MTNPDDLAFDFQVDLGFLFATLRASVVFGEFTGAHVDLDGTVLADTGLRRIPEGSDSFAIMQELRHQATVALMRAHREIGAPCEPADVHFMRLQVAQNMPMPDLTDENVSDTVQA